MKAPNPAANDEGSVISQALLDLLVCPVDKAKLNLVKATLICTTCGREYPIENGIPNMLVKSAV